MSTAWSSFVPALRFRIDSPLSASLWLLWMSRSRIASASAGSLMKPCQSLTGNQDDVEKQRLREQIQELLGDSEDDIGPDASPTSEAQWLPAPKPVAPAPHLPDTPSPYHRNAIECPQCDRWTWQATEECQCCHYSLFAHYQREEEEKLARRREWLREYNTRRRGKMILWMFGLLLLGIGLTARRHWPPTRCDDGLSTRACWPWSPRRSSRN